MNLIKKMAAMTASNQMNIRTFFTNVLEMNGEMTCSDPSGMKWYLHSDAK